MPYAAAPLWQRANSPQGNKASGNSTMQHMFHPLGGGKHAAALARIKPHRST